MSKISLKEFKKMMLYDVVEKNSCIEVNFCVDDCMEYDDCWLGKMPDLQKKQSIYWYGLVKDGSQAYDYNSLEEFLKVKIFNGKNIVEIWESITLISYW